MLFLTTTMKNKSSLKFVLLRGHRLVISESPCRSADPQTALTISSCPETEALCNLFDFADVVVTHLDTCRQWLVLMDPSAGDQRDSAWFGPLDSLLASKRLTPLPLPLSIPLSADLKCDVITLTDSGSGSIVKLAASSSSWPFHRFRV